MFNTISILIYFNCLFFTSRFSFHFFRSSILCHRNDGNIFNYSEYIDQCNEDDEYSFCQKHYLTTWSSMKRGFMKYERFSVGKDEEITYYFHTGLNIYKINNAID